MVGIEGKNFIIADNSTQLAPTFLSKITKMAKKRLDYYNSFLLYLLR